MKLTRRYLRVHLRSYLSPNFWLARLVFWGGAIVIGLVSALFALGTNRAEAIHASLLEEYGPYAGLVITPLGIVVIAWLTRRFFPGSNGSGIPQAIAGLHFSPEAHHLRSRLLSLRIAFGKVSLSLLGLLSGASIGREGPMVHIGASIMYGLGQYAHFPRHYLDRGLIVAGGAAGIAAAFNTPLAGVVFVIEEMSRNFEERTSGTILTAVVIAGVTAVAILGNYTYFGTTSATFGLGEHWLYLPLFGITGGLLGGLFARLLITGTSWLAPHIRRHPLLIPALCGLAVAGLGILSDGSVYGTGYHHAKAIITGSEAETGFPFYKMLATLASYFSGIPGGIFAPSLATGTGFGSLLAQWLSGPSVQAIVILTTVAYFTGVVQSPITAFVIVMEMTDNHTILLPLMATAFIAYGASKLICHESLYHVLAKGFIDALREEEHKPAPPETRS
jgi:H+/Cl- antiporter ClcA